MREIEQRKLPMIVRRHMPDGSAEDWSVEELEKMW
jgi:DNA-directed RNA polymerase I, II, and III subunit RPABC2